MAEALTIDAAAQASERDKKNRDLWLLLLLLLDDGEAQAVWANYVPQTFAGLVSGDGFVWNPQTQTYRSNSGTTVNANAVQRIVVAASHALEIEIETKLASAGQSPDAIERWRDDAMDELASMYVAAAAVGVGGIDNLTDDFLAGAVNAAALARESLEQIAEGLQSGAVSEPQAVNRAGMNAQQANAVFQDARRKSHRDAADENGVAIFLKERNVMTEGALHCTECPLLSARGWVDIGTLPIPGARECRSNCKCHLEYTRQA